jgi:uncharacterized hydrophobic protein (TIGR00271 family)
MRQLIIQVPDGEGDQVLQIAERYKAVNVAEVAACGQDQDWDLVFVHLSNSRVGPFMNELQAMDDVHVTLSPHSIMAMHPPAAKVADQLTTVETLSPLEIWLGGLQSIGSWKGFLAYALAGSLVVWIGLFTNTSYLLVAAMLIAPFAGPAMNTAIATASGDKTLLWHSLLRYASSLALTVAITALLSLILQQQVATSMMVSVSEVSSVTVLLPLVAGAAGALNQVQAKSNSLVSGAAVGILVAASLTPPAGVTGMAIAIGRWEMALNGLFVLVLQLIGINLAGALVFRLYGLNHKGSRYDRGKPVIFYLSIGITAAILVGLLVWQFSSTPNFQRSTRSQRAAAVVQRTVDQSGLASLVEANLRFTRPSISSQNTLLGVVYVQSKPGISVSNQEISQELTQQIQQAIRQQDFNVTPLIQVTVLQAPPG